MGEKIFSAHRKFEKKVFTQRTIQNTEKRAPLDSVIRIGQQFWQRSYFLLMSQRVEMSKSSSSSTKKVSLQQSTDDEDGEEEKTHRHVPTEGYLALLRQQKTDCDTKDKYLLITKYSTIGDQRRAYTGPLDPGRLWHGKSDNAVLVLHLSDNTMDKCLVMRVDDTIMESLGRCSDTLVGGLLCILTLTLTMRMMRKGKIIALLCICLFFRLSLFLYTFFALMFTFLLHFIQRICVIRRSNLRQRRR